MPQQLNIKHLKFVEQYLLTGNATQSYIDAGYTARGRSAEVAAGRLLRNVAVQQLLKPLRESQEAEKVEAVHTIAITRDRMRDLWAKVAWADPANLFNKDGTPKKIHDIDPEVRATLHVEIIEGVEGTVTKIKMGDRLAALADLAKTEAGVIVDPKKPPSTVNVDVSITNVAITATAKLAELEDAFARAAAREEAPALPEHDS